MLKQNTAEPSQTTRWKRGHDILFLILALASFLLLLALVSYSPEDSSWSVSSHEQSTSNAAGKVGAFLADVLFNFFGFLAYIVPILFLAKLVLLFRKEITNSSRVWITRSIGLVLSVSTLCMFAEMSVWQGQDLPAGPGGILGSSLLSVILPLFSFAGSVILLVFFLALGLMLYLEFSWLKVFESVGRLTTKLFASLTQPKEPKEPKESKAFDNSFAAHATAEPNERIDPNWMPEPFIDSAFSNFTASKPAPVAEAAPWQDDFAEPWDDKLPIIEPEIVAPAKVASKPKPAPRTTAAPVEKEIPIEPLVKHDTGVSERVLREQTLKEQQPLPSISVLNPPKPNNQGGFSPERLHDLSRLLVQKLADFGVKVEVVAVAPGPVITRFEIQPAPGVKASKITGLASDLARSMAMLSVRVVEVIPGKTVMGIEVPNEHRAMVSLSEVLSSNAYDKSTSPLTLALGHDIGGNPIVADLAKMPHLLVAGTTGSGKSVGVNAMILSMLFKATPEELRLIMVDPKMLELSVYEGIPHLLTPVVTDMKEASNALRWSVAEMERRYMLMSALGVRNLAGYNDKIKNAIAEGNPLTDPLWKIEQSFDTQPPLLEPLPYIVIIIDEFADMMMVVGKKVEELIARIAQKARAAGIHMILATQRPSVNVITGLIKANIPTRISFQVSSKIDSRTILDQGGAEQLLGHGDMLFMPPGLALPDRVHGAFVADDEVHRVVDEWKKRGAPNYLEEITSHDEEGGMAGGGEGGADGEQDELYDLAVAFVLESGKCSISSVQRKCRIGYNRAANLVEAMEAAGVVSPPGHNGTREVLVGNN